MASPARKYTTKWRYQIRAGKEVLCALCDKPITITDGRNPQGLTLDHIIPKFLGGTYKKENVQPAHKRCNNERGHMLIEEFKDNMTREQILIHALEILDGKRRRITTKQLLDMV